MVRVINFILSIGFCIIVGRYIYKFYKETKDN